METRISISSIIMAHKHTCLPSDIFSTASFIWLFYRYLCNRVHLHIVFVLLSKVVSCWGGCNQVHLHIMFVLLLSKVVSCWGGCNRVHLHIVFVLLSKVVSCWGGCNRVHLHIVFVLLLSKVVSCSGGCNRVHLHIVVVLLYSVCRSVSVLSCVYIIQSFTYVTCCDLDITKRRSERALEKARGNNNSLSHVPSNRKEEIKSRTSACGSFVVPYFQPATSINRLHLHKRHFVVRI